MNRIKWPDHRGKLIVLTKHSDISFLQFCVESDPFQYLVILNYAKVQQNQPAELVNNGVRGECEGPLHNRKRIKSDFNFQDVNDEVPRFRSNSYVGEIAENSQRKTPVTFLGDSIAEVFDHDQGTNGTFNLILEDDSGLFEVSYSNVFSYKSLTDDHRSAPARESMRRVSTSESRTRNDLTTRPSRWST